VTSNARILELSAAQAARLAAARDGDDDAVSAFVDGLAADPVRLTAEIVSVKRVSVDAGVSYGHTYRTKHDTTLLLAAIGYRHGLPRKAGNRASVTWEDSTGPRIMPIVGRVAMDVMVIDAGDSTPSLGDRVVLFGRPSAGELGLTEWAQSVEEHPVSLIAGLNRVTTEADA
jgi:alanine racemase